MKIHFLLSRRVPAVLSPMLTEAFGLLTSRGFEVRATIPEQILERPDELAVAHDLYVLKSQTELSLSLAGILHAQGARVLNPYPSCLLAQNKIVASRVLREARIPAPDSWVTGDLALLAPIVNERPLVIKPYIGHRGDGVQIVRNAADLAAVPAPQWPVLVQEYIPGGGEDLKVYVVDDRVFAVRKTFSPTSFAEFGRPCPVSPAVRDIALRCGRAFGLGLYGLDLIENPNGLWVVDVNYSPGYRGVSGAGFLVADYIERYATGECGIHAPQRRTFNAVHGADTAQAVIARERAA